MSRIGIGANTHQPNKECLDCKYWKPAKKEGFGSMVWTVGGKCSAGYCKKKATNGRNYK